MAYKSKTELKAESSSTFPTNGVRQITASAHRGFNEDLIDSFDTVDKIGLTVPIKTEYFASFVGYAAGTIFPIKGNNPTMTESFLMSKVKDSLLSNVLAVEPIYLLSNLGTFEPYYSGSALGNYTPFIDSTNYPGVLCVKKTTSSTSYCMLRITYIPAE